MYICAIHIVLTVKKPRRNLGLFYAFTVHKAILPFITIAGNQRYK